MSWLSLMGIKISKFNNYFKHNITKGIRLTSDKMMNWLSLMGIEIAKFNKYFK